MGVCALIMSNMVNSLITRTFPLKFCISPISSIKLYQIQHELTLCLLSKFHAFCLLICLFFSKSTFSKNSFWNTIRVSNSLDPEMAQHFVEPDLGPNSLQMLSADNTGLFVKFDF